MFGLHISLGTYILQLYFVRVFGALPGICFCMLAESSNAVLIQITLPYRNRFLRLEGTFVDIIGRQTVVLSSSTCHSWGKEENRKNRSDLFHIAFSCIFFASGWHQFGSKELQLGRPWGRFHIISPEHSHYWRVVSWGVKLYWERSLLGTKVLFLKQEVDTNLSIKWFVQISSTQ